MDAIRTIQETVPRPVLVRPPAAPHSSTHRCGGAWRARAAGARAVHPCRACRPAHRRLASLPSPSCTCCLAAGCAPVPVPVCVGVCARAAPVPRTVCPWPPILPSLSGCQKLASDLVSAPSLMSINSTAKDVHTKASNYTKLHEEGAWRGARETLAAHHPPLLARAWPRPPAAPLTVPLPERVRVCACAPQLAAPARTASPTRKR